MRPSVICGPLFSGGLFSFHGFKSLLRAYDSSVEASYPDLSLRSRSFILTCPLDISTWRSNRHLILHKTTPNPFQLSRAACKIPHPRYDNWNKKPRATLDSSVSLTLCNESISKSYWLSLLNTARIRPWVARWSAFLITICSSGHC